MKTLSVTRTINVRLATTFEVKVPNRLVAELLDCSDTGDRPSPELDALIIEGEVITEDLYDADDDDVMVDFNERLTRITNEEV